MHVLYVLLVLPAPSLTLTVLCHLGCSFLGLVQLYFCLVVLVIKHFKHPQRLLGILLALLPLLKSSLRGVRDKGVCESRLQLLKEETGEKRLIPNFSEKQPAGQEAETVTNKTSKQKCQLNHGISVS